MGYTDVERREFFRLKYNSPAKIRFYETENLKKGVVSSNLQEADVDNISQNGVLFQTEKKPPQLSSLVWMDLDLRTLKICQEIESRALILNHGVLGKVVRVEEDPKSDKTYDIGVCFLRKDQQDSRQIQSILSQIDKSG